MKVSIITLGCDKNTVDSERYLAQLRDHGAEATTDLSEADVILVNSCGFIDAAKKESIDALIEAGRLKDTGRCQAVVGVGCLVERHKAELAEALPEIDVFLGTSEIDQLIPTLQDRGLLRDEAAPQPHPGVRLYAGDLPHVRYLKISEGCDHGCAFCAIPLMRGKHRSFASNDVVAEAQVLEAQGARELNLVAQDLGHWGRDRRAEGRTLPDLLEALVQETTVPWIRLLYLYSAGLTPRLLELMAREPRILPYLDIPIQHGSDRVLTRMRRPERRKTILETVARIRAAVPDVAIRTTCIVGFPGETDEDFDILLNVLEETMFDRVGVFTYSAQEGTRAADLTDDVPDAIKRERLERVNEMQRLITAARNEGRVGRTIGALVDRVTEQGVEARVVWQADDVDGITMIADGTGLRPGTLVDVAIQEVVDDVSFQASVVRVVSRPSGAAATGRSLPVMRPASPTSVGSYGR